MRRNKEPIPPLIDHQEGLISVRSVNRANKDFHNHPNPIPKNLLILAEKKLNFPVYKPINNH